MEAKLTLAERLKDERNRKKLTLAQVEQETGVSRAALGGVKENLSPLSLRGKWTCKHVRLPLVCKI